MADSNLVTTCSFHGQEYLFKMKVLHGNLEILVTDKNTGEEWQCSYDATYIENLTHKTGNFKQFDIFVAMIKSGLLRTSESVSLDLLTFEDLEMLRTRKITKTIGHANTNRRYLILTYVVEFDKIRYPLPLEYCGMPDPIILQTTIRRLELELAKTKEELALKQNSSESKRVYYLQKKVDDLTTENSQLKEEIRILTKLHDKKTKPNVQTMQKAVFNLEKSVVKERKSHHELVEKLRNDNAKLLRQLEQVRSREKSLEAKFRVLSRPNSRSTIIGDHPSKYPENVCSTHSVRTMFRRSLRNKIPSPPRTFIPTSPRRGPRKHLDNKFETSRFSRHRGRSKSSSESTKYQDIDEIHQRLFTSRSLSPSPARHSHCLNTTKCNTSSRASSRASSQASRESRVPPKGSTRKSRSRKKINYQMLENKIEHLQRLLKSNYLSR